MGTDIHDKFAIDGNHLYLLKSSSSKIRVYDKFTGNPSLDHPKINNFQSGWDLGTDIHDKFAIDGNNLYLLRTFQAWLGIFDKFSGINKMQWALSTGTDKYDKFFINNDHLYLLKTNLSILRTYDKLIGIASKEHPKINRYESGWGLGTDIHDRFFIEGNNLDTNNQYYNIYSCGYGLNNSIKRIQSIISVETSNKTIKQISWREVF